MSSDNKNPKSLKKKSVKQYKDNTSEELANFIENLTHSGNKYLNLNEFNVVINICERSDEYIKETYTIIFENLQEKHSEVRFSALQICDEIFRKYHCFRELVVSNLEKVVNLTFSKNLPPPATRAGELRRLAVTTLHHWNNSHGKRYIKLSIAYDILLETEEEFSRILIETGTTLSLQQEESFRKGGIITNIHSKRVLSEIKDRESDMRASVTSLSNSINLLLPHPDDFFIVPEEGEDDTPTPLAMCNDSDYDNTDLRDVGISSVHHSVQLTFTPSSEAYVKVTSENSDIVDNVKEYAKLVENKYLPTVKAWLEILTKTSEFKEEQDRIVDLKNNMADVIFKYRCMVFVCGEDVSSDSDLEEVIEGQNLSLSPELSKKLPTSNSVQAEPSTSAAPVSRKERLLAVAPKLPFDIDLYHWEDEKLPVPTMMPSSTEGHRFWVGADTSLKELPVPGGSATLRTRVIEFGGTFTPVNHVCRVRLPSGRLCPRRDRYRCPFHGEIVPRDEKGDCINLQDALRMKQLIEKRQQDKPDWQDPKLLAEIKKTTGIDLKMPVKGKRKKKQRKHPGLTDLKQSDNTAMTRLKKKIFKKSSVKKVAATMDRLDAHKFTDKFGDQFNYFYKS